MVKVRNNLAQNRGYDNYFEFQRIEIKKIPDTEWQKYLTNRNLIAQKYIPNTDAHQKHPHFLSKIDSLNLFFPDDVIGLFQLYPEMIDIRKRIDLTDGGELSKYKYDSKNDRYWVTIADTNHNQKIAMLIHELSHVLDQEKKRHKIISIYEAEKDAHIIEFEVAKNISQEFLLADTREYLACFVRTDFEEFIYTNPDQNPSGIFSQKLKKYFGDFAESESDLYLFDNKIIQQPLSDLPTAVSLANILI